MKKLGWFCWAGVWACFAQAAEPVLRLDLGGGVGMELVLVPAGSFRQGSPPGEAGRGDDETQHEVRLSEDYYIGRTAVTRGQWARFVAASGFRSEAETGTSGGFGWNGTALEQRKQFTWRDPGFTQDDSHPVCLVTFPDAEAFCRWLGTKAGRKVGLPTEAQWEYACRAGTATAWHAGDEASNADLVAWHKGNAGNGTRPAGAKQPNPWGLVIGGNVAEWCRDWYAPYPSAAVVDPLQTNPNLSDKPRRVLRGGSWLRDAKNTRSAARFRSDPRSRNADIGFRVVCAASVPAVAVPPVEAPPGSPAQAGPGPVERAVAGSEAPASPPVSRSVSRSVHVNTGGTARGISLFTGLLCLLVPVVVVLVVVRLALRGKRSGAPALTPVLPARAAPKVRLVDDGFWFQCDWPPGTGLALSYLVGGLPMSQRLVYQPGPEGQYVFTGQRPASVTVTAEGDEAERERERLERERLEREERERAVLPPVLPDEPFPGSGREGAGFGQPPRRPSAY